MITENLGFDAPYMTALMAQEEGHPDRMTEVSTWCRIDLTDAIAGVDVPAPELMARSDGRRLLYRGKTHAFVGESESCKSWAWQVTTDQILAVGGTVMCFDFEDDERSVISRLRALGAAVADIGDRFIYIRPEEPLVDSRGKRTSAGDELDDLLASYGPDLVVIDGVTEAMTVEGLDLSSNTDVARWSRRYPKRCAAGGAAVVMVDHVPKSIDNRGRYAIGGQHKLAGLTGAQYVFETKKPLSRAIKEPAEAVICVKVAKDRPGHVRSFANSFGAVAEFRITGHPDGRVVGSFDPPNLASAPDAELRRRIVAFLATNDGVSKNTIEKAIGGNADAFRRELVALEEAGQVRVDKTGRAHLHFLTDAGRDALG